MVILYLCIPCGKDTTNSAGSRKGYPFKVQNKPVKICAKCYYRYFIHQKANNPYTLDDIKIKERGGSTVWLVHLSYKQKVVGSNPISRTTKDTFRKK